MVRKLITYNHVAKAAQTLHDAGKNPTVIAIRALIGKGSFTTISTYLRQWHEAQPIHEETPIEVTLPESIVSDTHLFLRKLYILAKEQADEQLESERETLRQQAHALQEEQQQATKIASDATEEAENLTEQLTTLAHQKNQSDHDRTQFEKSLSLKSAELERAQNDIEKLEPLLAEREANIQEQRAKITRTLSHLEQVEHQNKTLHEELATLEDQLAAQTRQNIQHTTHLQTMQDQHSTLNIRLEEKQAHLSQLQNDIITAEAYGKSAEKTCQRLSRELEKWEEKSAQTDTKIHSLMHENGLISGQLQEKNQQNQLLEKQYTRALDTISQLKQTLAQTIERAKVMQSHKTREQNPLKNQ